MADITGLVAGCLLWLAADASFLFANVVPEQATPVAIGLQTRPGSVRMVTEGSKTLVVGKREVKLATHDGKVDLLVNSDTDTGKGSIKLRTDSNEISLPTDDLDATLVSDAEQNDNNTIRYDPQSETALKSVQLVNDENQAKLLLNKATDDADARLVLTLIEGSAIQPDPVSGIVEVKLVTYTRDIKFAQYVCLAVPVLLGIFLLSAFLFNGLISFWTTDEDREWWSRSDAWVRVTIFGLWAFSVLR